MFVRSSILVPALILGSALALAGCAGPKPDATQRAATDLNPSGRPYAGPPGIRIPNPQADLNVADPLRCHPEGAGEVCSRS